MKKILVLLLSVWVSALSAQSFFSAIAESAMPASAVSGRKLIPTYYRVFSLNEAAISATLASAPPEFTDEARQQRCIIALPQPDGGMERFAVWHVAAADEDLYRRYPTWRTFAGVSLDQPGKTVRGSLTVRGFRAMIFSPDMNVAYVEPYADNQTAYYMAYDRRAYPAAEAAAMRAGLQAPLSAIATRPDEKASASVPLPGREIAAKVQLRQYRLAISATGEFSQDHGGTVEKVTAALLEYANQLSAIFERDVNLRFQFVSASSELVYLDGATDPFPGPDPGANAGPNTLITNTKIGTDKYDIGHVLMRGGGGVSLGLGIVCATNSKGGGCTAGRGAYGDPFVGIFCQEVGHQLAGNHTWSRCGGFAGDQRNGRTAYEPGSGSTIMSYVGGCGQDNLQFNTDLYFHGGSIEEMRQWVDFARTCGTVVNTDNNAPEVKLPYKDNFSIPIGTPFELKGEATDPDGDALTYCWEGMDYGPEALLGEQVGNSASFRTFPPVMVSNRYFPKLENVLNNTTTKAELLPAANRDMTLRLTVRDNKLNGGGVAMKQVAFRATAKAGPFLVKSPNSAQDVWRIGTYTDVTWDPANTQFAPVNCRKVNLRLSTDGGKTWPHLLAEGIDNDGRHNIIVPDLATGSARLRIDAADNVFYDVSNFNFAIAAPVRPALTAAIDRDRAQVCLPDVFTTQISTVGVLGFNTPTSLSLRGRLPNGATATFSNPRLAPGQNSELNIDCSKVAAKDSLNLTVQLVTGTDTIVLPLILNLVRNNFSAFALQAPTDGATGVAQLQTLRWRKAADADRYDVQIARNPTFDDASLVATRTGTTLDSFRLGLLLPKSAGYYWRVRPDNACSPHPWSEPYFFATLTEKCSTFSATDLPKNLTASATPTVESKIEIAGSGAIADVNVKQIRGTHEFFRDLEARLVSPDGKERILFRQKCGNSNGSFNFGFDDSAPNNLVCPAGNNGTAYKPEEPLGALIGGEAAGIWTLKLRDGTVSSGGTLQGFQLELCSSVALNPPVLVNNNPLVFNPGVGILETIPTDLLQVKDNNNAAAQLTYTLVTTPRLGELLRDGAVLPVGATFTQADIDGGVLRYRHQSAEATADYFRFTVTDGEGGFLGTPAFAINPNASVSAPESESAPHFSMQPNPASDEVYLNFKELNGSDVYVSVYDLTGREVRNSTSAAGQKQLRLSVATLPSGVYVVRVQSAQGNAAKLLQVD